MTTEKETIDINIDIEREFPLILENIVLETHHRQIKIHMLETHREEDRGEKLGYCIGFSIGGHYLGRVGEGKLINDESEARKDFERTVEKVREGKYKIVYEPPRKIALRIVED